MDIACSRHGSIGAQPRHGRLNPTLFPNGVVTDVWERTDGASWIIDQTLENAGG